MNLYHNPNNDDECDNSISSQCEVNTITIGTNIITNTDNTTTTVTNTNANTADCCGPTVTYIWQRETEMTDTTEVNFKNGKLSSQTQPEQQLQRAGTLSWWPTNVSSITSVGGKGCNIIGGASLATSAGAISSNNTDADEEEHAHEHADEASATKFSHKSSDCNTCPEERTTEEYEFASAASPASAKVTESYFHQMQKWRQRPRGQHMASNRNSNRSSSSSGSPSKPVIWNLFNFGKMHSTRPQKHQYHHHHQKSTLTQLSKYFLVMLVILPTVWAVPSLEQQQHQQNALPRHEGKPTSSANMNNVASSSKSNSTSTIATAQSNRAAISQHVNTSNNYPNSRSNSDNDLYRTSQNLNTTNAAVKIILNDYSDAFSQIINNENEQQEEQQLKLQQHQNSSTSPQDHIEQFHGDLLDSLRSTHSLPRQPMYTNEFAVHVPAGPEMADIIASKYGFTNMGQVSVTKHSVSRKE